jgi:myo-inositol-1(or 4)-monophosphatase
MNIEEALEFAKETARRAGEIQRNNFEKKGLAVEHKGRIDLVTEVDIACEKLITEAVRQNFPEHGILAEEGARRESLEGDIWIIDPLDGTVNYAHGFPMFAVSIALYHKDEPVLGVVYDPLRDEIFTSVTGRGAYMNDAPIKVTGVENLENALIATGFPYDLKTNPRNNLANFNRVALECQAVRRPGAAAIDLCYLACGRFDAFWEQRLCPWDMAAARIIVAEAGGKVTDMKGNSLDIFGETICAANPALHPKLLALLED